MIVLFQRPPHASPSFVFVFVLFFLSTPFSAHHALAGHKRVFFFCPAVKALMAMQFIERQRWEGKEEKKKGGDFHSATLVCVPSGQSLCRSPQLGLRLDLAFLSCAVKQRSHALRHLSFCPQVATLFLTQAFFGQPQG